MPRDEILDRYSRVTDASEIIETYRPLVDELHADIVTFQMTAPDQLALIRLLGEEVLPAFRG